MDEFLSRLTWLNEQPWARPIIVGLVSFLAAFVIEKVLTRAIAAAASRTETELDDRIIEALRRPIFVSVILFGLSLVLAELQLAERFESFTLSVLKTLAVLVWAGAILRVSHEILLVLSNRSRNKGMIQHRTIPIFDMVLKIATIGGAVYFFFLAWDIDVTAWLASAGIIGIAVGFAAKDSLANLFAGLFIIADAPYKVGDYIVLEGEVDGRPLRGEVTGIGMRSSRILTRDDLEITIPNSVIGNSKIINETGGPSPKQRARVAVGVSYGSDVDKVAEVLLTCVEGVDGICDAPPAEARFRGFGESSLDFELLFWTDRPMSRGKTRSMVNFRIYKALAEANITIPFPQRDLWIKEAPGGDKSGDLASHG